MQVVYGTNYTKIRAVEKKAKNFTLLSPQDMLLEPWGHEITRKVNHRRGSVSPFSYFDSLTLSLVSHSFFWITRTKSSPSWSESEE